MLTAAPPRHSLAAVLALVLLAAPATAADKVTITSVSVGLPTGRDDTGVSKFGAWAPVYVRYQATGAVGNQAELVIEAPDTDEVTTVLTTPVDLRGDRVIGYVRPVGVQSEFTVTLRAADGSALSEPFRARARPREPLQYVVLALGGAPTGFELPKLANAESGTLRGGRVDLAHIARLEDLPDHWSGYDGADLVILNTGTAPEFVSQLFAPNPGRLGAGGTAIVQPTRAEQKRLALLHWVGRGGRLAVSLGANAGLVKELPSLANLLAFALKDDAPTRQVEVEGLVWSTGTGVNTNSGVLGTRGAKFPMANLRPDHRARVLIPPPSRAAEDRLPAVVQSPFGLGRLTLVGFDLDSAPFADFQARADFWDFVLREAGAARASGGEGKPRPPGVLTEEEDEAAVALRAHNDSFDGVPVVSFGWVAVLIVLYILVVGPVEYVFLKRVLGRLELTWVTFPLIALTASVLAYVSAAEIKGRDLKVNKLDVLDIDADSGQVCGSTWFTVFSPRNDSYSVAVTPNDGWATARSPVPFLDVPPHEDRVTAVGAPRAGRASLTRRKYAITEKGLENVPVQVWSTKAFLANWSAPLQNQPALVVSDLRHPPGDRSQVIGTFRHDLPIPELTDCVMFYAGQAYPLFGDVLTRGSAVRVVLDQGVPA
ncbi:MAG: hypothetical protein K2V38_06380, partial [Gemmataceae bacterium]|nr:hypothetical protein [Gemmataceae bacterium]